MVEAGIEMVEIQMAFDYDMDTEGFVEQRNFETNGRFDDTRRGRKGESGSSNRWPVPTPKQGEDHFGTFLHPSVPIGTLVDVENVAASAIVAITTLVGVAEVELLVVGGRRLLDGTSTALKSDGCERAILKRGYWTCERGNVFGAGICDWGCANA